LATRRSYRQASESTGAGVAGPRPPDSFALRLPVALFTHSPGPRSFAQPKISQRKGRGGPGSPFAPAAAGALCSLSERRPVSISFQRRRRNSCIPRSPGGDHVPSRRYLSSLSGHVGSGGRNIRPAQGAGGRLHCLHPLTGIALATRAARERSEPLAHSSLSRAPRLTGSGRARRVTVLHWATVQLASAAGPGRPPPSRLDRQSVTVGLLRGCRFLFTIARKGVAILQGHRPAGPGGGRRRTSFQAARAVRLSAVGNHCTPSRCCHRASKRFKK
jgi:hypothetical protein